MFDIGFFELLIIAIVGLVVIGPERLPEAARAVGLWIGRLKRSLRETRSELEKQLGADDIRRQLHNEEVMRSLEATRRQVQEAVEEGAIQTPLKKYKDEGEAELPDNAHTEKASVNAGADKERTDKNGTGTATAPESDAPEPEGDRNHDDTTEPAPAPRDQQTPSS